MYFGKQPGANGVKLGILTNGAQWQFFTDLRNENAMDVEPFFSWDVLKGDPAQVVELLTILQKSKFTPQLVKTFAERKHHQAVLVDVVGRLLKPSPEFVNLAIGSAINESGDTLVSGKVTEKVIEQWKPILADAIHEWAKQQTLTIALQQPAADASPATIQDADEPAEKSEPQELRKKFWEGLVSRPKIRTTRHANIAPGEYSRFGAGSGVRGAPLNYFVGQYDAGIEVYIDRGSGQMETNKRIFDSLHSQRNEIEKVFGSGLSWDRLDGKQASRIAYAIAVGGYRSDESKWQQIHEAMIDAMIRLEKALAPHLVKLKTELSSEGG
jgi:hypothetical protein